MYEPIKKMLKYCVKQSKTMCKITINYFGAMFWLIFSKDRCYSSDELSGRETMSFNIYNYLLQLRLFAMATISRQTVTYHMEPELRV